MGIQGIFDKLKDIYIKDYKKLMIFTLLFLVFCIGQIGYQIATTGDFVKKGVSINGGLVITVDANSIDVQNIDIAAMENDLKSQFSTYDISAKEVTQSGMQAAIIIEASITEKEPSEQFISVLEEKFNAQREQFNIEFTGSTLGNSFFKETLVALIIAFILMGVVVIIYFRLLIPSAAVILCGFSDIVCTLAVFNMLGMKLSTAGIVGFLLLIGYSVDTDILLTVRVLKRKEGTVDERVSDAIKTGLTMTLTTVAAVLVALFVSNAETITQIMTILFIGLTMDILFTWVQNVGLLKLYLEIKEKKLEKVRANV